MATTWLGAGASPLPRALGTALRNQPVLGDELRWPMDFRAQGFRCYVVEPLLYEPSAHARLFTEVLQASLAPVDRGMNRAPERQALQGFDLMTFPEAFLHKDDLVSALRFVQGHSRSGLYHVGLRATTDERHLFTVEELKALVQAIRGLDTDFTPSLAPTTDLDRFELWLDGQEADGFYNVGCLFMVDALGRLRVCLHPKNIPSPLELDALPEATVTGADFVVIVVLVPEDKAYRKIHLQPLICSDALDLTTTRGGPGPMAVVTSRAGRISEDPPEHIDVVSIVTCTPLVEHRESALLPSDLWWHPLFRAAFTGSISRTELARHDRAIFVMSNFRYGPRPASSTLQRPEQGLSGGFIPAPFKASAHLTRTFGWGRHQTKGDDVWERMDTVAKPFHTSAQLVAIHPDRQDRDEMASLMYLAIPVLPRFQPRATPMGPTSVLVTRWRAQADVAEDIEELTLA